MKQFLFIALFLTGALGLAQDFEDRWVDHFSYVSVKSISQGDGKIFVGAENSVFVFDLATQEFETVSTVQGLSGEIISTVHYSEAFNQLYIGYENGLIEVYMPNQDDILSVVDILDKPTIPPNEKRVNHFHEYQGNLYIAAQFGISVFNMERLEFGDTYFIGDLGSRINITQTTVFNNVIYASSSSGGLRSAPVDSDDLIDYQTWTTRFGGNFQGVQTLGDELYTLRSDDRVLLVTIGGLTSVGTYNERVVGFQAVGSLLTVTTQTSIQTYSEGFNLEARVTTLSDFDFVLQSGLAFQNSLYLGTTENGLLAVPFGTNAATQILPDGPILNTPFSLDASPGQVWVNFGEVDVDFDPSPESRRGVSQLKEGSWTNIPYEELFGATDLVQTSINPENPQEVFMTSFGKGLLKIIEQEPSILYDASNSPLEEAIVPSGANAGIRLFGMDWDRQNNLWFTQSKLEDGLIKLAPSGQFQKIDVSSIVDDPQRELALTKLEISREGYVFFGSYRNGVIGYNPANGQFNKIEENIGNGNLPTTNVRALAFDNQNRLWIGTLRGLRVLFNVSGFFEEGANIDAQEIIFLEDGVPQELLFEQSITDIEVDGSNNKWIATATSGVFYVSPNGQETILRFNKQNSPLPSNNIRDIAIDDFSGMVYFATENGLVAYNGNATAPRENLDNVYAYPNPVRPGFLGNVTIDGLTANANVKITDIEGNLVFEETSEGGSVLWDTTAFGNYKVASGVYLVLITTDDALETKVSKIMVVR